MTLAISLALIAGLFWGISNVIDKAVLSRYVKNPLLVMPVVGSLALIVGTFFVVLNYQSLAVDVLWRLILFSALNFCSIVFYFLALKREEVSRMVPLYGTTPAFMVLIELMAFGTKLTMEQYIGVIAVVIGAIILSYRSGPIKFNKKGLALVLTSSIFWATAVVFLTDIFDKHGYWLGWGWLQVTIGVLSLLSLFFIKKDFINTIKEKGSRVVWSIVSSQLFSMTAGAFLFYAGTLWVASLSSAIASDQFIFTFLFSLLISWKWPQLLKEEVSPKIIIQKTISILLIVAGIFLISL